MGRQWYHHVLSRTSTADRRYYRCFPATGDQRLSSDLQLAPSLWRCASFREGWSTPLIFDLSQHYVGVYDFDYSLLRAVLNDPIRNGRLRSNRFFLFLFHGGYVIGLTPIPILYVNEIWPSHLRTKGNSVFWVTQAVAICFNQFVNPVALDRIAWRYYLVYVAVLVLVILFMLLYVPETKGLSLEEVGKIYDR